ncbi:TIM barrel protein [uncultured Draconibacterium sp.]|uniref:sugar phosphate isomerase/epimerase family protein n=1 Tax=uncultured Draconibacterium sp. TaxID=1573823 RepID=UPI0025F98128|nr:TIM barrel protein [uncultured Draconibacterium sp.]
MNSRRTFITTTSLASAAFLTGINGALAAGFSPVQTKRNIYIFSKHLQWLDYNGMAKTACEVGFDGIDLTVRPKGHVLPERVKDDLPLAIEAIKSAGLLANRMTTAITDAEDARTIDILETAAKLGVKHYRLGWLAYNKELSIIQNIKVFNTKLKKLAELNKKLGLTAAYQNHAGVMAGGPVWDMGLMLDEIDPTLVGIRYDIRHATVEGGTAWPLGMKFIADKINSFDIKDFYWKENNGEWKPNNVPLGKGMVDFNQYFEMIKSHSIKGDFTLHLEYPIGGAEKGAGKLSCAPEDVIAAMKQDLNYLKKQVQTL